MLEYLPIAKTLIDTFKTPLLELLKDLKAEAKYFFDSGLPSYVSSQYEKYNLTKTFIHRSEPVEFKTIYFPVTITLNNKTLKLEDNIWDIFSKSKYIGIVGIAGSGKSMLMKHIYLNTVETYKKIPIVIELRDINDYDGDFIAFVYKTVLNNKLSPNSKILERLFESGNFLLLLDGYDEINFDRKSRITKEIDEFVDKFSKNYYVISSRPGAGLDSIPRFSCYHVRDLNNHEIESFIKLQIGDNQLKINKILQTIALPENRESEII